MKTLLCNAAAILFGALLFAASFPNPLFSNGLPLLAWIAYVPVFWVLRRSSVGTAALWGALYGYTAYRLFAPWLGAFHPLARTFVSLLQLAHMALLFPLLRLALKLYPKKGYIAQWLIWLAYEYLRTLGFLGFPYGITGYTQWQFIPLISAASVFGVWGVSALVLFPSVYLAQVLPLRLPRLEDPHLPADAGRPAAGGWSFFRRERLAAALWLGAIAASLAFGLAQPDYGDFGGGMDTAKIALIQQNSNPWIADNYAMRQDLAALISLSEEALKAEPATELVVWPETAFVPRIYWHLTYRDNAESYEIVKELMNFLARQKTPFLIGNDDARREAAAGGYWDRVDYNAALLFEGGEIREVYRKNHLVPFAEYFPYEKTFPRLYQKLTEIDTHFWKPGTEKTVFRPGRLRFAAPICFEDCFGYISRDFTKNGAEFIVNITNDSWAGSLSSQNQHLAMAVFRAVENRRSLVRAAASGQTCAIAPSGKILAMAPAFTQAALSVEIPLVTSGTPYSYWGDLWGILFTLLAAILLLSGAFRFILGVTSIPRSKG